MLLALLISEYTRVSERMNTDDGNLIWPLSNCTFPFCLREYETQSIKSGLWTGGEGGSMCVCVCVCVKRAIMSVMTEGCEGICIEGRHVLFGGV